MASTAVPLADGTVLIFGHYPGNGGVGNTAGSMSAEIFTLTSIEQPVGCCGENPTDIKITADVGSEPGRVNLVVPPGGLAGAMEASYHYDYHDSSDGVGHGEMVRAGAAINVSNLFTYNNSLAEGRKMTRDLGKLMLRAYNAEAENCIRSLRVGNVVTAKKRLKTAATQIAKLGSMMEMRISDEYHQLRIEEVELTADYLMKVQEEKEAAREERERLREEKKAEAELAAERERLNKERSHLANALEALKSQGGDSSAAADLQARLGEIDEAIEQNDYRAANIRAGYVYVISNRGAFGKHMVKIGLTRRLDPMDRIRELGDASVPFPFDIHALFFADDAVTLENELHEAFAARRVNHVNLRREFFFATPQDVHEVLQSKVGALLEFHEDSESTQYLQSRRYWPSNVG